MFRLCCVGLGLLLAAAERTGATAADLAQEIQRAARDGRQLFVVPAGRHVLPTGLILGSVSGFTLRGEPGAVPRLNLS